MIHHYDECVALVAGPVLDALVSELVMGEPMPTAVSEDDKQKEYMSFTSGTGAWSPGRGWYLDIENDGQGEYIWRPTAWSGVLETGHALWWPPMQKTLEKIIDMPVTWYGPYLKPPSWEVNIVHLDYGVAVFEAEVPGLAVLRGAVWLAMLAHDRETAG